MKIAIIPARGGSKRIPGKNIKKFRGKPIISYAIEAAKDTELFDKIIVSTDDTEIAEISKKYGAEAPFIRPAELSDDFTPMRQVLIHTIESLESTGADLKFICTLFATAPFVQPEDITTGYNMLQKTDSADYVLGVTTFPFPIQRALKISTQKTLKMFDPNHFLTRSQDLEEAYHDAGQICWARKEAILGNKDIFDCNCLPLIIPNYRVQDIDTPNDWKRAEITHRVLEEISGV